MNKEQLLELIGALADNDRPRDDQDRANLIAVGLEKSRDALESGDYDLAVRYMDKLVSLLPDNNEELGVELALGQLDVIEKIAKKYLPPGVPCQCKNCVARRAARAAGN